MPHFKRSGHLQQGGGGGENNATGAKALVLFLGSIVVDWGRPRHLVQMLRSVSGCVALRPKATSHFNEALLAEAGTNRSSSRQARIKSMPNPFYVVVVDHDDKTINLSSNK